LAGVADGNLGFAADVEEPWVAVGEDGHQAGAFAGFGAGQYIGAVSASLLSRGV
jgi:hypothetical protein